MEANPNKKACFHIDIYADPSRYLLRDKRAAAESRPKKKNRPREISGEEKPLNKSGMTKTALQHKQAAKMYKVPMNIDLAYDLISLIYDRPLGKGLFKISERDFLIERI